jgi:hypothetical protein
MRAFLLQLFLLVSFVVAQESRQPLLVSHDDVDGPTAGESGIDDLTVFSDGRVIFLEKETKSPGQPATSSSYETILSADDLQRLSKLLDSRDIRDLPNEVAAKTKPIDFFWQKSLEISRAAGTQKVQIKNFYPFLNFRSIVYPKGLIELECTIEDIKTRTAKRPLPKDEDNWCRDLLKRQEK